MKTTPNNKSPRSGFTLIEMIGVLAIIAVLAALLIPRIFSAINESRVNGAALSYNGVKSAAMSYFGKYGRFGNAAGAAYAGTDTNAWTGSSTWDTSVLLAGGFLEKPFETKLGTDHSILVVPAVASGTAVTGINASFDLDGSGSAANDTTGQLVVVAHIAGVPEEDAQELSAKIDGADLSDTTDGNADLEGRVKYAAAVGGVTDVFVYIAHK